MEAYSDNPEFKAMLYTGKVKLYNSLHPDAVFLKPGQTAQLVGDVLQVSSTKDVNSYRWKDGLIYIEDQSFSSIMRQFEKFYDVKIVKNTDKLMETTLNYSKTFAKKHDLKLMAGYSYQQIITDDGIRIKLYLPVENKDKPVVQEVQVKYENKQQIVKFSM